MTAEISTNSELIHIDSREQARSLILRLAQQAKREICFFGGSLDPALFDTVDFVDCISEFARQSDKTSAKFVVHSIQQNIQNDHRLLSLVQRLSSSIHIHTTAKQHQSLTHMFMLIDDDAYLYCQSQQYYQGRACFYDPMEVKTLKQTFSEIWDQSIADTCTRRLYL